MAVFDVLNTEVYSYNCDSWIPAYKIEEIIEPNDLLNVICNALKKVIHRILESEKPFDAIFGFSQGGIIATLINNLDKDVSLLAALEERTGIDFSLILQNRLPFSSSIIACAAAPFSFSELRSRAGLGNSPVPVSSLNTIHLIGRTDPYRAWSESFALEMNSTTTDAIYLNNGHEIDRLNRENTQLLKKIRQCLIMVRFEHQGLSANLRKLNWMQSSDFSSRAVSANLQLTAVKLEITGIQDTIIGMLSVQPANSPFLRVARESDANRTTTYGQMLEFCQAGGGGDLRRLGVHEGEVVAYLTPSGGSVVAASAFLSIASQTCAAPFGSNMSEGDAMMALQSYGVRHMVLFEGVIAPGVKKAFETYARQGHALIHHAVFEGQFQPGIFVYQNSVDSFVKQPVLSNPATANCLLLRTSGTTSKPKIIPQTQRNLLLNAAILADGIGISASDVTYSVMPLDHIGGLSASILCSIAVGASVTCEGLYNPQAMVDALMESKPRPTWYSAVPTIHNATLRYLRDNADIYLDKSGCWRDHDLRMIRSGAAALKEADRQALELTYGCEVVATYSMSELMPISQPPRLEKSWHQQTGAVGVPVTASMAIVDPITLQPLPFGSSGDVAISGPTLFAGYLGNPSENESSRFLMQSYNDGLLDKWFLTGDLGEIATDGTLILRGRLKELIKRGGEQIAPAEVENLLTQHPWVNLAICFPVPSVVVK